MQSLHDVMPSINQPGQQPTALSRRSLVVGGAVGACVLGVAHAQNVAAATKPSVHVLAASDLKFALADIAGQYQRDTGVQINTSLGSSGNFARQISQGLPADIFMSADEALVQQLERSGHTTGSGVLYAIGRIALLWPKNGAAPTSPDVTALRALLHSLLTGGNKFAIANPEHAPYGRAAREALQALGLWDMAQPRLVLGENIAQATQFVTTGAAQAGITALSLALSEQVQGSSPARLRHVVLPGSLHAPLRQQMVLLKNASPAAQAFFAYLQSAGVRRVLARYGFSFDSKNA